MRFNHDMYSDMNLCRLSAHERKTRFIVSKECVAVDAAKGVVKRESLIKMRGSINKAYKSYTPRLTF